MKETLAERNARYLAEGRTVSGGDGNGPGKPGSRVVKLTGDPTADNAKLDAQREEGFTVEDNQPPQLYPFNYLLLGNYAKKDS